MDKGTSWQPIETAPHDRVIALFGSLYGQAMAHGHPTSPIRALGYWDPIDEAWALTDTPWSGPFMRPTLWQEAPPHPHFSHSPSSDGDQA